MVLFDNELVTISLDTSVPCLEWIGKQYMPSEAFRESEEKSLEFFRQHKKTYPALEWYVDAREIGALFPEDVQFVVDKILPGFAEAGLTKEGFVVPTSAIGKMVVQDYESKAGDRISIKNFDTVADAKEWLAK